jgi:signal transduction histidine kinase/predicted negative regulator of RcsB-dependent stress response
MRLAVLFIIAYLPCLVSAQSQTAQQFKDSLLSTISTDTPDTSIFSAYQKIALAFKFTDLDSTLKYTLLAEESIEIANYPLQQATILGYKAYYAFMTGNYDESLDLMDDLLAGTEGIESLEIETIRRKTLNDQGTIYAALGMYELALSKFYNLYEMYQSEGVKNESFYVALSNIGVMYNRLELYEKALEIFLQLDEEMPATYQSRMSVPVNLGFIYYDLNEFDKAKYHLNNALAQQGVDPRVYGLSNFKLGQVYIAEGEYERAIDVFYTSIDVFTGQNNELETVQSLNGLAQAYMHMKQLSTAYNYAKEGLEITLRFNAIPERKVILETLYQITKAQNKYEEALAYHEQFKEINDFITTSETTSEIERLSAEYEYRQREEQLIAANNQESLMSEAKINHQRTLLIASVSVIIFAFFGLIGMYRMFVQKRMNNELLSQKNLEIELQAKELRESNMVKNRIFSMIAHDLRGPLSSLHAVITLIELNKTSQKELDELIPSVSQKFQYTSTMLNNLLHWSASQMKEYKVDATTFDLIQLVREKENLNRSKINEKKLRFEAPSGKYFVHADRNMVDLVIQNLIANAIKFCNEEDSISVAISNLNGMSKICVSDTGIGIPKKRLNTLFSGDFYTTSGTKNEKGTGLGLMLCKEFVESNEGKIWVESVYGKGTTVCFTLNHPA